MNIIVNGKKVQFEGKTVLDLIESYKFEPLNVVIELNGKILHRENYESHNIIEDDKLEVVTFVGGG